MATDFGSYAEKAIVATKGFTDILWWGFLLLLGILIVYGIFYLLSFKHRVRIRQLGKDGRELVIDDKAREFKDKSRVRKWKLLWTGQVVELPPDDCIDITKKGKIVSECYRTADGTIIWIRSRFDLEHFQTAHPDFEPFKTEERVMAVHEYRQAEEYKNRGWSDKLFQMAPVLAVIMILVIFMIFFNQVVAPTRDLASNLQGTAQSMSELGAKLEAVCLERPTLQGQNDGKPNTPPN